MSNHFHLLVQVPEPRCLSRLVAGLLVAYWHHYRRRYGLVGHLFQGRFKSPAIEAEAYLLSCGRSVERNPCAAGLVGEPWAYRWSSAAAYACGAADALLAANPWYEALAAEAVGRQARWRAFVLGEDPKEAAIERQDWLIGSDAFRIQAHCEQGRTAPRTQGRPLKPSARQRGEGETAATLFS
jgi:putative transposase